MEDTTQKIPTDQEVIDFYEAKISVLEARCKYQKLDTEITELIARKYEALNRIAQYTNKQDKDGDKSTSS